PPTAGGGLGHNLRAARRDNTEPTCGGSWGQAPSVYTGLQPAGNVSQHEMYRTFNCGVGMIIALPAAEADKAIALLNDKGENAWKIGYIKASDSEQRVVIA
ncbi:AIR synthase-related protein, partial [Klebsiella pneumoniae]|nr:AIR synthase-related protein [Klebsiella pneumoniae]